jgi:uncharacterized membrane protein
MQGISRKVVQGLLYEAVAVFCVAPVVAHIYKEGLVCSGVLSVTISVIAVIWNMVYNTAFEYWERRRQRRARTMWRRVLHSTGFEGGLTFILVPLMSCWLKISWLDALLLDVGLFVFFFVYSLIFQWTFERVFDVPDSAREVR